MELGCGVGLTAVCAAFTGTKVIFATGETEGSLNFATIQNQFDSTDVNEEALKVCSRNVDRNSRKISSTCDVRPKFFDWDTKSFHNG